MVGPMTETNTNNLDMDCRLKELSTTIWYKTQIIIESEKYRSLTVSLLMIDKK